MTLDDAIDNLLLSSKAAKQLSLKALKDIDAVEWYGIAKLCRQYAEWLTRKRWIEEGR